MSESSVLLVNYRTEAHVLALVSHLAHSNPVEQIIVVDNSPDGGLGAQLAQLHAGVTYVASPVNIGFAGGVNLGLSRADRDNVILLNPDTRPEPGCLAGLVNVLAQEPGFAIAGPRLVPFEDGQPVMPSATRIDPGLLALLAEYTPVRRVLGRNWLAQHYFLGAEHASGTTPCAMVQGACFAFKRQWLDVVGSFDALRFFLYWEETDFCRRVRLAGGVVLYCPQFVCRHLSGASLGPHRGQDVEMFWRSFYAFQLKHFGSVRATTLKLLLGTGIAVEYVLCSIKNRLWPGRDPELHAYLELVRQRLAAHLGGRVSGG